MSESAARENAGAAPGETRPLSASAQKVQDAIRAGRFDYTVFELAVPVRTSADAAREVGCEVAQIAKSIITQLGIDPTRRVSDLTESEVIQIREVIDRDYLVEGDLRRDVAMNIKRLMDLGCYRGLRHRKSLPVRGQRTHTNARTRKGPAKAIAGKKKVTK